MAHKYSAYEAKAKFSEVMRRVRAGQRIIITYHDREVAEIRPIESKSRNLEQALQQLEDEGVLSPYHRPSGRPRSLGKHPEGLARFLESRE